MAVGELELQSGVGVGELTDREDLCSARPIQPEECEQLCAVRGLHRFVATGAREAHEIGEKRDEELRARILRLQIQAVAGELKGDAFLVEANRSADMTRGTARFPLLRELRRCARILWSGEEYEHQGGCDCDGSLHLGHLLLSLPMMATGRLARNSDLPRAGQGCTRTPPSADRGLPRRG